MKRIFLAFTLLAMAAASCTSPGESARKAVLDNIMTRTSIRSFTSQPVPEALIEQMLLAGMAPPLLRTSCLRPTPSATLQKIRPPKTNGSRRKFTGISSSA